MKRVNVTARRGDGHLDVNGTNGNDTMTAANRRHEPGLGQRARRRSSFTGFNVLNLNGGFGNDTFNVSPVGIVMAGATPAINVAGPTGGQRSVDGQRQRGRGHDRLHARRQPPRAAWPLPDRRR